MGDGWCFRGDTPDKAKSKEHVQKAIRCLAGFIHSAQCLGGANASLNGLGR